MFPDIYKRKPVNNEQQSNRYNWKIKHQKVFVFNDVERLDKEIIEIPQYDKINSVCSVGTQVTFDFNIIQFKFECEFNKSNCDVITLAYIPPLSNNSIERSVKSVACGLDISCLKLDCFQSFNSILNESQLRDLTETTFKVFNLLLSLVPQSYKNNY